MQGTILILDGISTNRIMLKVQLSAAYYHVVQCDRIAGLMSVVRRTMPDLILTAMSLPDGDAVAVHDLLKSDATLAGIPIIAITRQNDRAARLLALGAGLDDVLSQPVDDLILQARIRSLIRAQSSAEEIGPQDAASSALGFAEPAQVFAARASVALVTQQPGTGALWRSRLQGLTNHNLRPHQMGDIQALMTDPVPDAIVVELTGAVGDAALRLMADLRARSATRHAAIIAVTGPGQGALAADALDRGAHDVMQTGFCAEELSLRLKAQLRRKARADRLRASVRNGLRAAVIDPMTGLFNRRYALPQLAAIARDAAATGSQFAVMLADLDHFKHINDHFGHPAGDAVLTETARRLSSQLRADDLIARVGGEEFLIVMPNTDLVQATHAADRLCRKINSLPFLVAGIAQPISVTTSIGVVVASGCHPPIPPDGLADTDLLIDQADRALYEAKNAGRNQVTLIQAAA